MNGKNRNGKKKYDFFYMGGIAIEMSFGELLKEETLGDEWMTEGNFFKV